MTDVVIFGIGDFGRIARLYLERDGDYRVVAFTVHREYADRTELAGVPVVPFDELPGGTHRATSRCSSPPDSRRSTVSARRSSPNARRSAIAS